MLFLRAGGILLMFGAALPLALSLVPSVERGYYKNLSAREIWRQLNAWSLRTVEGLAGDPQTGFFGQILADGVEVVCFDREIEFAQQALAQVDEHVVKLVATAQLRVLIEKVRDLA
jgi:hypothetical protein